MQPNGSRPSNVLELEPDIDPAEIGDAPIAYFPDEGWLDPVVYMARCSELRDRVARR